MSASVVAVTQMACVGLAWGNWSSSLRVVPSIVAVPCTVLKRCSAGDSFIGFVVMRWIASTATTPGRISFEVISACWQRLRRRYAAGVVSVTWHLIVVWDVVVGEELRHVLDCGGCFGVFLDW